MPVPEPLFPPPGDHHAGTLDAFAWMGLDANPRVVDFCDAERVLAAAGDLRDEVIDALFPTAHGWH